jgi:hypothetical protein
MHSFVKALALGASISLACATIGSAKTPHPGPLLPPAGAAASKATLAALVGSNGTAFLKKGVVSVTHTAGSGVYCVFPNNATLVSQLSKITPQVSPDFGTSPDTFVGAQYNSGITFAKACPSNSIEVRTFNFTSTPPSAADEGFSLIVW